MLRFGMEGGGDETSRTCKRVVECSARISQTLLMGRVDVP